MMTVIKDRTGWNKDRLGQGQDRTGQDQDMTRTQQDKDMAGQGLDKDKDRTRDQSACPKLRHCGSLLQWLAF